MRAQGLTKMRIPSASFCQLLTIWLSSSSAALEYMEKNGPELSPKLGSFDGRFGANRVWLPSIFLYASLNLERTGQSSTVHTWVVPSLKVPARHLREIVSCYEDLGLTALTTKRVTIPCGQTRDSAPLHGFLRVGDTGSEGPLSLFAWVHYRCSDT